MTSGGREVDVDVGGLAHLPPHVQWTIETGEVDLVNILHGILSIIGVLDDEV